MSLIEKAVDQLARNAPPAGSTQAPAGDTTAAASASESSLIERAMAATPSTALPANTSGTAPESTSKAPAAPQVLGSPARPVASPRRPSPVRIAIEALRARGMVTPDAAPTALSQEFRVIKRPLLDNAFGRGVPSVNNGRRVMVTSAFSGEGKSFCAINLAMSIAAERDTYVLLVDADVAKPSIPTELGIESTAGLMDCLIDPHLDVGEVVLPTNVERLSVLPAGRRHEQATELLASAAMGTLVDHLASRYDDRIIIFDSPPILMTTEARVLASYMGQIVMVVEAGNTSRDAVTDALTALGSPEMVGMVLNKSRESRHGGYQGYGYGHGNSTN
ncbi:MAG: XrtA-associated tyrosine autokinase [Burkholderiales bacterium]|jgi:protein-tyrosine kinase